MEDSPITTPLTPESRVDEDGDLAFYVDPAFWREWKSLEQFAQMAQRTVDVETRFATQKHNCVYCDIPVEQGQEYVRIVLVKEGEIEIVKFHRSPSDCDAKR